jgi:hypothetical protein
VNRFRWLFPCVFVLSLVPSLASADEPSVVDWAKRRVENGLVAPLAQQESHRFSRGRPPPRQSRVRVTNATATVDKNGRSFVPFAIDVRFISGEWQKDDIVGCVYMGKGDLFVKKGDAFRPAAFLLGKNVEPVAGVCEAGATAASTGSQQKRS